MSKINKGFVHIFLVLVVFVVGVGALGYYAFKNGQIKLNLDKNTLNSPTPSISVASRVQPRIENSNWKTYSNSEYNYSFKYPDYLELDESVRDSIKLFKPIGENNVDIYISFDSFKNNDYGENLPFVDFLINRAIQNCAADGMDTSIYCDKKIDSSEYANSEGTNVYKFHLNLVRTETIINKISNSTKGPLWGIDITGKDKNDVIALYIEADYGNAESKNIELAQKIVDTIKIIP